MGQIVPFRQTAYTTTLTQTAADSFGALNFVLTSASNYTGFTDLWDVYRVDYLEFSFEPAFTANAFTQYATNVVPRIYTVIDLDDSVTPTTLNSLREYQSCRTHMYEPFKVTVNRPGVLTGVFDGSAIVAGAFTQSPWIDAAKISIPHYGLKYGIEGNTASSPTTYQSWNVSLVVGLSFKNVR